VNIVKADKTEGGANHKREKEHLLGTIGPAEPPHRPVNYWTRLGWDERANLCFGVK